jgi:hypothetical protein
MVFGKPRATRGTLKIYQWCEEPYFASVAISKGEYISLNYQHSRYMASARTTEKTLLPTVPLLLRDV